MTIGALKARLRDDLEAAMRTRKSDTVALLRTLAAALANAEAVPLAAREQSDALRMAGGGPTEAARRDLSPADFARVLDREHDERIAAAAEYEARGKPDEAARLRAEAALVARYRDAC